MVAHRWAELSSVLQDASDFWLSWTAAHVKQDGADQNLNSAVQFTQVSCSSEVASPVCCPKLAHHWLDFGPSAVFYLL